MVYVFVRSHVATVMHQRHFLLVKQKTMFVTFSSTRAEPLMIFENIRIMSVVFGDTTVHRKTVSFATMLGMR